MSYDIDCIGYYLQVIIIIINWQSKIEYSYYYTPFTLYLYILQIGTINYIISNNLWFDP